MFQYVRIVSQFGMREMMVVIIIVVVEVMMIQALMMQRMGLLKVAVHLLRRLMMKIARKRAKRTGLDAPDGNEPSTSTGT